jgi:hypothetical protein
MSDPFEDRLRATFRHAAQQTTTSHDFGLPPAPPPPRRSRRLVVTAALTLLALVGVGALVAARDDGPQTVQAAAGDEADARGTTVPTARGMLAMLCSNASSVTLPPRLSDKQADLQSALGDLCAAGGEASALASAYAGCADDLSSIRDLFGPLVDELRPQLDQLKAIFQEFEPRFRAIADDPATKARIEAGLAPLRQRLESLADPANRPDLSDPEARRLLFEQLQSDLAPLKNDTELTAKIGPIADDLEQRLESLAASPEVQALKDKVRGLFESDETKSLVEKLVGCLPR